MTKVKKSSILLTCLLLALLCGLLFYIDGNASKYIIRITRLCAINIVLALSMNLVNGFTGIFSLGHAGFMSVGAFAGIVTTTCLADAIPLAPLRLAVAMIVGAAFAHNFALAGNPDALNDAKELVVGGIGTNGKIAVAVGFVVLLAISLINSRQKEVQA